MTNTSKKNQDVSSGCSSKGVDGDIKNLSSIVKSAKSKKPNFTKANSGTDFLTLRAKEAFIHLQKAITKALILKHFDPKRYIWIETNALGYAISEILSQMTSDHSDQLSSNYVTHKNINPILSKVEIDQW